jgi:hypothetical protein
VATVPHTVGPQHDCGFKVPHAVPSVAQTQLVPLQIPLQQSVVAEQVPVVIGAQQTFTPLTLLQVKLDVQQSALVSHGTWDFPHWNGK